MAYCVLPFEVLSIQIYVLTTQRTTCLLTPPYAVKTSRPRVISLNVSQRAIANLRNYYSIISL